MRNKTSQKLILYTVRYIAARDAIFHLLRPVRKPDYDEEAV